MKENKQKKIDYDLFEYIIAFNCTFNDLYTTTVLDSLKLEYLIGHQQGCQFAAAPVFSLFSKV